MSKTKNFVQKTYLLLEDIDQPEKATKLVKQYPWDIHSENKNYSIVIFVSSCQKLLSVVTLKGVYAWNIMFSIITSLSDGALFDIYSVFIVMTLNTAVTFQLNVLLIGFSVKI
jgi:hypothetical protein